MIMEEDWITKKKKEILDQPIPPEEQELFHHVENMSLNESKRFYRCEDFVVSDDIQRVLCDDDCVGKIALWQGDITVLQIDAIVNAANEGLLGGGGIDGAIHEAAGPLLQRACAELPLCETGQAAKTFGFRLPARYVIHTVGPYLDENDNPQPELLKSCYENCLRVCKEDGTINSIAFCSISTGFYGYPKEEAAKIAIETVISWLKENPNALDHVIFCCHQDEDLRIYRNALNSYAKENGVNLTQLPSGN
jgi:O-acetyl-ADP-ribose deacetylase (regulator of RNase III)